MKRITAFVKKDTVLFIALLLAVVSMFIVPPDKVYFEYVDFRTLAILFCLMSVMAGLQKIGVFNQVAKSLLGHVKSGCGVVLTLVLLCFFSSMFITNDVALITFVPFTFIVLGMFDEKERGQLIFPVVVMQTIAANLGSMLTPIGNPQNLYLYGKTGISVIEFVKLMLPYTAVSLVLLFVWAFIAGKGCSATAKHEKMANDEKMLSDKGNAVRFALYAALFILCLLTVVRVLPWQVVLVAVLIAVFISDRRVLLKVDYSLLLTFVAFFVFIGNVGRIPAFRDFLQNIIGGREVYTAIIASQVISNVPAALLLSGFTNDCSALIIGTNLGGLGTLIASMASLISYKYIAKEAGESKRRYIALFTAANICFLAVLILLNLAF